MDLGENANGIAEGESENSQAKGSNLDETLENEDVPKK